MSQIGYKLSFITSSGQYDLPTLYYGLDAYDVWIPLWPLYSGGPGPDNLPSYIYSNQTYWINNANYQFRNSGAYYHFYWPSTRPIYWDMQEWQYDAEILFESPIEWITGWGVPSGTVIQAQRYRRTITGTINSGITWSSIGTQYKLVPYAFSGGGSGISYAPDPNSIGIGQVPWATGIMYFPGA
jgi:hypothetical protein